jgi:hypothetical protein
MACNNYYPDGYYYGERVTISVYGVSATAITLNLCLPPSPVFLVRSTNLVLLEQCPNISILYDNRLSKVQLNGPGFVQYTDTNVIPNTCYFYRLLSPCGNSWLSCIVRAVTPTGTNVNSVVVNQSCSPSSGLLNLGLTFGTVSIPLFTSQYYLLQFGTNSLFITVSPGCNTILPTVTTTWTGTSPAPTVTSSINPTNGIISLSLANINVGIVNPTSINFSQVTSNGGLISGPTTIPLTIQDCPGQSL